MSGITRSSKCSLELEAPSWTLPLALRLAVFPPGQHILENKVICGDISWRRTPTSLRSRSNRSTTTPLRKIEAPSTLAAEQGLRHGGVLRRHQESLLWIHLHLSHQRWRRRDEKIRFPRGTEKRLRGLNIRKRSNGTKHHSRIADDSSSLLLLIRFVQRVSFCTQHLVFSRLINCLCVVSLVV